ncbi:MAG: hypothetical protein M0Q95_05900 [Porticoccaceae bacterium]|nr:hypothetical protein [Porticoccaceae bacterium]
MDPISFILSTYINTVSSTMTNNVSEIYGTEMQSVATEYHGHQVTYSYQMWKIKPESVCRNQKSDINQYSKCTIEAKSLFDELCDYLQTNPGSGWRFQKNKNMYCTAAISYQPVIASIQKADQPTPIEIARKECNTVIAENMGDGSPAAQKRIEKACESYNSMQE